VLRGFVCPAGTPTNEHQRPGQRNEAEYCLGHCPNPCVSPPLLAKMWSMEQSNVHQGDYLSASMLSGEGCPRQTWYERQPDTELYEVPRRRFWPTRGTVIHGLIEGVRDVVAPHGWLQELRMLVPLVYPEHPAPIFDHNGVFTGEYDTTRPLIINIRGTTDAYNPWRLWLHDFKTLADYRVEEFLEGKQAGDFHEHVKNSWVWQVNIYAWLIAHTVISDEWREYFRQHRLPDLPGQYFPAPNRLQMQLISMMEPVLTATGRLYQLKVGRTLQEYHVEDVPTLPLDDVESFIRPKALQWYRWLTLGEIPPVVDKKRQWMCRNCPFYSKAIPGERCPGA
jgi:hypothetical protein